MFRQATLKLHAELKKLKISRKVSYTLQKSEESQLERWVRLNSISAWLNLNTKGKLEN